MLVRIGLRVTKEANKGKDNIIRWSLWSTLNSQYATENCGKKRKLLN